MAKKMISFLINPVELAELEKIAKRRKETISEMLRQAVRNFIQEQQTREPR